MAALAHLRSISPLSLQPRSTWSSLPTYSSCSTARTTTASLVLHCCSIQEEVRYGDGTGLQCQEFAWGKPLTWAQYSLTPRPAARSPLGDAAPSPANASARNDQATITVPFGRGRPVQREQQHLLQTEERNVVQKEKAAAQAEVHAVRRGRLDMGVASTGQQDTSAGRTEEMEVDAEKAEGGANPVQAACTSAVQVPMVEPVAIPSSSNQQLQLQPPAVVLVDTGSHTHSHSHPQHPQQQQLQQQQEYNALCKQQSEQLAAVHSMPGTDLSTGFMQAEFSPATDMRLRTRQRSRSQVRLE